MSIISLFCGCGGLDLGFEEAGFEVELAYDADTEAVASWNANRSGLNSAYSRNIVELSLEDIDLDAGKPVAPTGVIGGPPCQSFSRANSKKRKDDPRSQLIDTFYSLALDFHTKRRPLDFIVLENVPELEKADGGKLLKDQLSRLEAEGFKTYTDTLNALNFGVPQNRVRLFVVAIGENLLDGQEWSFPSGTKDTLTLKDAIGTLPEPVTFADAALLDEMPLHPNHWCMTPKSRRFFDNSLKPGDWSRRSFKTLSWKKPSITVSYGNREVHVHPSGRRRLSVFESMLLQGFPDEYVLQGTLSAQFSQVSQAVPPPVANSVARAIFDLIGSKDSRNDPNRSSLQQTAEVPPRCTPQQLAAQ